MLPTTWLVSAWIAEICAPISSVAFAVWLASDLDLARDHGKALAGFAGPRGLDGGVERQQVGLARRSG